MTFKNRIVKLFGIILVVALAILVIGCDNSKNLEINTDLTENLKLDKQYENKSFLKDGIGKVTLSQNVDGDTAHFKDSDGTYFQARFLMINTPESTGKIDPWGKAAGAFVKEKLLNAYEIVAESEEIGRPAVKDTTNKRYLSYIWYKPTEQDDFRLLNLEIVEECYSRFVSDEGAGKYGEIFQKAEDKNNKMDKRFYGEKDPDFDYSYEVTELTIAYLKEHKEEYVGNGSKIKVRVRILRIVGNNLYVEDVEKTDNEQTGEYDTAGIYMYTGYTGAYARLKIGTIVSMQCQCSEQDTYGFQLINPMNLKIETKGTGTIDDMREFDGKSEIDLASLEGLVIKIDKVKIIDVGTRNEEGAQTLQVETESGQIINVRIDKESNAIPQGMILRNNEYRVLIGGVSKFNDTFQIMLCNSVDSAVDDFKKID